MQFDTRVARVICVGLVTVQSKTPLLRLLASAAVRCFRNDFAKFAGLRACITIFDAAHIYLQVEQTS